MSWQMGFYSAAICDRCGHELEDIDTGTTILFKAGEPADLASWDWQELPKADGTTELICSDCRDLVGAEDATIAADAARYAQTGPDLLGGGEQRG